MKICFSLFALTTILFFGFASRGNAQDPTSWSEAATGAGVYSPVVEANSSPLEVVGGGRRIGKAIFDRNWSRMIMVYAGYENSNGNGGDVFDGRADVDASVIGVDIGRRHSDYLRSSIDFTYRNADLDGGDRVGLGVTDGEMDVYSLMKNVHFDLPMRGSRLQPYIGVGAGLAYADAVGSLNGVPSFVEGETSFAYQGMAGLSYKLRNLTSVYAEYRYFLTQEMDLVGAGSVLSNDGNYSAHDVLFGLKFGF